MSIIEVKNLKKSYKNGQETIWALNDVSLNIEKEDIFGIIGLSGAGKSTLIRCLNLLEKPTQGTVNVNGQELTQLSPRELRKARLSMGMIFQHFNLLNSRTVAENVSLPMEIAGYKKKQRLLKIDELLELVGLEDKKNMYPSQLSGGQKQRVGIARALAINPKILLCDEATSALDPQTTDAILELLLDIKIKLNLTIVIITHEMHVITEICNNVAIMEDGKIIEQGPVLDIFINPQHPTSKDFVEVVINQSLPKIYENYQSKGTMVRLLFTGFSTEQPVISKLMKNFEVEANILSGQIDHIKETPYGLLILDITGSPSEQKKAVNFLQAQDIKLEVLNV